MDIMKFIQPDPAIVKDLRVRNDDEEGWIQTDKEGKAFLKVLWTDPTGGWAVLFRWAKGYAAPAHKHLGSVHAYIISGRLRVRDMVMEAGDYVYEANGMIHEATTALEETVQLNIADGPILFFNDDALTHYAGWEQMRAIQEKHAKSEAERN